MSLARPKPQREQDRAYRAWIGALPCIACACEGRASERSDCAHVSFLGSRGLGGVAIVGRPVARARDDGATLEVTRLCTDGTRNACSFLYGCCARAAHALGYARIGTYTLGSEGGASLRGAGWRLVSEVKGRSWDTPSPPAHRQASDHRQVPLGSSMTPQDQGAASPAQEPALKPEELDRLEGLLADEWPSGFDPWKPFGGGAAQRSTLRALIAQARTVPPAAAPDGELREAIQAALETIRVRSVEERAAADAGVLGTIPVANHGGRRDGLIEAGRLVLAALAAAPVTGDRETAGVEAKENVTQQEKPMTINEIAKATRAANEARPTAEYVHRLEAALNDMKAAASDAIQALNATVERDGPMHPVAAKLCAAHGIASGHARFASEWLSKRALATPPSGGGDHAGGEASDAVTLDGGVTEAAPALGPAELSLRLEWAIDVLRVVRRIATGDASAIAQAGLDLAEADEDALLAAGSDEALASLAAARATAAPASGKPALWVKRMPDGRVIPESADCFEEDVRAKAEGGEVVPLYLAASPKGSDVGLRDGIYVASKTSHAAMWREYRGCGQPIISTWIDEAGEGQSADLTDLWNRCVSESARAGVVILYHDHRDTPLKGALVEVGVALALGTPVFVVSDAVPLLGSFTNHPLIKVARNVEEAFLLANLALAASRTGQKGAGE